VPWADGRGISYRDTFIREDPVGIVKFANITCIEYLTHAKKPAGGRSDETAHSVISLQISGAQLPKFSLGPRKEEGWLREYTEGGQTIVFEDTVLDAAFFGIAADADELLGFITPGIRTALRDFPYLTIEGAKDTILFYRHDEPISLEVLSRLLDLVDLWKAEIAPRRLR
jgi:hypothetical protein